MFLDIKYLHWDSLWDPDWPNEEVHCTASTSYRNWRKRRMSTLNAWKAGTVIWRPLPVRFIWTGSFLKLSKKWSRIKRFDPVARLSKWVAQCLPDPMIMSVLSYSMDILSYFCPWHWTRHSDLLNRELHRCFPRKNCSLGSRNLFLL